MGHTLPLIHLMGPRNIDRFKNYSRYNCINKCLESTICIWMANIIQLFKVTTLQLKNTNHTLSLAITGTFLSKFNWVFGKGFSTNIIVSKLANRYFQLFGVHTLKNTYFNNSWTI
jgi:hypothetical protein